MRANKRDSAAHLDVPVEIYVMGAADVPPVFQQAVYRFNILEDCVLSTIVGSVSADSNETISYRFVSDDDDGTEGDFDVNSSGDIVSVRRLDRETREMYELIVRAETRASPPLVAHARVLIHVGDVNDNAPRFETERYAATVAEGSAPGTHVIQVLADDADFGRNGQFYYVLSAAGDDDEAAATGVFVCDSSTGSISSTVALDRESVAEYRLIVRAVDRGAPRLTSVADVVVSVGDENDNAPVFVQTTYGGAVNEDALPGTIILAVSATDADVAPNDAVTYHVAGGDVLGQFGVRRRSGELYVNKLLDREEQSQYRLDVLATDGAYTAVATVHINILDANDNSPVCEQVRRQADPLAGNLLILALCRYIVIELVLHYQHFSIIGRYHTIGVMSF